MAWKLRRLRPLEKPRSAHAWPCRDIERGELAAYASHRALHFTHR